MARWWLGGAVVLVVGCAPEEVAPPAEDVLRLELGGANRPLGQALHAVDPRPLPGPSDVAAGVGSGAEAGRSPGAEPVPVPEPEPEPEPEAERRTVRLGKGQTVYGLAQEHLGSGARWREILELNGWSEAAARRLRPGTAVALPAR